MHSVLLHCSSCIARSLLVFGCPEFRAGGDFSAASRHFAECVKNVANNFNALAAGAKWKWEKWKMLWKDDKWLWSTINFSADWAKCELGEKENCMQNEKTEKCRQLRKILQHYGKREMEYARAKVKEKSLLSINEANLQLNLCRFFKLSTNQSNCSAASKNYSRGKQCQRQTQSQSQSQSQRQSQRQGISWSLCLRQGGAWYECHPQLSYRHLDPSPRPGK